MRALLALLAVVPLAGCSGGADPCAGVPPLAAGADGVKTIAIHIGWSEDRASQYMRPGTICVDEGDKVRFVVTNDDDSGTDYNGGKPGKDNFHDVALLDYAGKDYEHEAYAGKPPVTTCGDGDGSAPRADCRQDHFVASVTGTFRIICEVRTNPSHDALGMHASFVVR